MSDAAMTSREELAQRFNGVDKLSDDDVKQVAFILTGQVPNGSGFATLDDYLQAHFGITPRR